MTVNDDVQKDLRCPLTLENVPDSVKCVTSIPEALSVNLRGSGASMFSAALGRTPRIRIDYRLYQHDGVVRLSNEELRTLVKVTFGGDVTIMSINPDTLRLVFTSRPPVRMPITIDSRITTLPNCTLTGPLRANVDSVLVYSVDPLPAGWERVKTVPLQLTEVGKTMVKRTALQLPPGVRAVPDSVDVRIEVEPMISRTISVPVQAVNVPKGKRLILLPNRIDVSYTVPMSKYSEKNARIRVTVDYHDIARSTSGRIPVSVNEARGNLLNSYLRTDSVEYIIEE